MQKESAIFKEHCHSNCNDLNLDCRIEIRTLEPGHVIMTEDSHNDAALVYILSGSLIMSQRGDQDGNQDLVLYTASKVK